MTAPKYADEHVAAVEAVGYDADVYDVDANNRTAPHHLGVLGHYDAVVWESGDDVIPRSPGQPAGTIDDNSLATELAVRDYLNEGGKLLVAGQNNRFAEGADGVYDYNPDAPPECTTVDTYPCLPVFNDFLQYWLGSFTYVSDGGTDPDGNPYPVTGTAGAFSGFEGDLNAPGSAENQGHTASFLTTSSFLPPSEFPQFESSAAADWVRPGGAPYDPHTGDWYAYSQQDDVSYKRLTRTIDLTGASRDARLLDVLRPRGRLGLRVRRGAPGGQRRLDDPAGRQRAHDPGHRRQLCRGLGRPAPVPGALPGRGLLADRLHG